MKFAGPTKKMMQALEDEGLNIRWPKAGTVKDDNTLAIEGTFYTGTAGQYEKLVVIDLRDRDGLDSKSGVDYAISSELDCAYEAFDVNEEFKTNLDANGAPDADVLLEDMKEQEKKLHRFSVVADAVLRGREIPEEEDNTEITISGKDAMRIVELLKKVGDYKYNHSFPDDDKAFANMIADEITNKVEAA